MTDSVEPEPQYECHQPELRVNTEMSVHKDFPQQRPLPYSDLHCPTSFNPQWLLSVLECVCVYV